jgi:CRISPR-associated Cas5-like protein
MASARSALQHQCRDRRRHPARTCRFRTRLKAMDFLVFQLQAPLASWGDTAVGEYRGSYEYPGESALLGLLAAALGIRREDDSALAGLRQGYGFAVGVQDAGTLLRDYHTAQVPGRTALKGRPHATRRDELAVPKRDLHTILSTRDYRQNAACLVAVQTRVDPPYTFGRFGRRIAKAALCALSGTKILSAGRALVPDGHRSRFGVGLHSNRTSRGSNSCVQRFRINGDACHWRKSHP